MIRAVVSLGSNLGDRLAHLQGGLDLLAEEGVVIVAVSGVYETAPVGGPEQGDFLNAVALVESPMTATELLAACQRVEAARARVREVRWGPRTLDIDIVWAQGVVSDDAALTLPHPRAHERAFVCVPWLDVDPDAALPQGPVAALDLDRTGVARRDDLMLVVPVPR